MLIKLYLLTGSIVHCKDSEEERARVRAHDGALGAREDRVSAAPGQSAQGGVLHPGIQRRRRIARLGQRLARPAQPTDAAGQGLAADAGQRPGPQSARREPFYPQRRSSG